MLADLAAPRFTTTTQSGKLVIAAESKADVVARLGRSPDRGDAVVMAYTKGANNGTWGGPDPNFQKFKVSLSHENRRQFLKQQGV